MYYDVAIAVPASTTKGAPVKQELKMTQGIIHRVEVQFPAGCRALAHCVIMRGGHQVWPTNPDGDFASDDYVIPIDEHYALESAPYILDALCWNEDDTYAHEITIRIGILPAEILSPLTGLGGLLKKFLKLVGVGG